MSIDDQNLISDLFWQAKDAYDPENGDHRHLRTALENVAEVMHREKIIDDGMFTLICQELSSET